MEPNPMNKNLPLFCKYFYILLLAASFFILGPASPIILITPALADIALEGVANAPVAPHESHSAPQRIIEDVQRTVSDGLLPQTDIAKDIQMSDDPCLPPLYKDWSEFSADSEDYRRRNGITGARILINLETYNIALEAIIPGGENKLVLSQNVAVGDTRTPTPQGSYILNHIYCYPDVLFFGDNSKPVSGLYNGFLAPLLVCDENMNCRRIKELGIHGFQGKFHPNLSAVNLETFGAVSAGCIRIPDPCSFKMELIRTVGIGPMKNNDRGSYHWLKKPVEVLAYKKDLETGENTLVSILEESISTLGSEISNIVKSLYK